MSHIPIVPTFEVNYLILLITLIGAVFIIKSRIDIKQLEKKMKNTNIQISGVGHDLKNKITTIQLYTQIMQKKYPKQARRVLIEIENMTEIVENLTLEAAVEDNRIRLKKEQFELVQFLRSIIDIKKNLYSDHKIVFETKLKSAIIVADKIALDRIIQNLIQNAVKYSIEKSTITTTVTRFDHAYRIAIQDHGIGIPVSKAKKIFNAYEQLGKSQGMGLGLHIVKTLVEAHSGRIYLESEVGKGTTFYIELPIS